MSGGDDVLRLFGSENHADGAGQDFRFVPDALGEDGLIAGSKRNFCRRHNSAQTMRR